MGNTIGVALIAKDAEKSIRDCIESFAEHVDQIVVAIDSATTDKTAEEAQKASPKVEIYPVPPMDEPQWIQDLMGNYKGTTDFAASRNFSFSKLKTDWYLWVDSDDQVYQPENLHYLIDNARPEVGCIWLPYHYALDEFFNVTTLYERERILRASLGWIWKGRLHETVSPLTPCQYVRSDAVIIRQNHLIGGSRNERNFKLLEIMYKEEPEDKRIWLYLGHQHFAARNWMDAAHWYLQFGSDINAIALERYQALCYCVKAMREMKDKQAVDVALMAVELQPNYKDAYLELAHSYFMIGDFDRALHWIKVSDMKQLIEEPPHLIFINPLEYTFNRYCLLSDIYSKKGDLKLAIEQMQEAYKVRPHPEVENHIASLKELESKEQIVHSIKTLAVHLLNNKELVKLEHLLHLSPYWFRDTRDYKVLEEGIKHFSSQIKDAPEIVEGENNSVTVNLAFSVHPKELVQTLNAKYDKITLICPIPNKDSQQINAFSQSDLENLIMLEPGNHIINLRSEDSRVICEYDKKPPQNLAVRIFVGQGLEKWNPQTIKIQGAGGSETAVALIAQELAKKDCQPILYAMDNQIWDGVLYRPYFDYKPTSISSHLFISSRVPEVFNTEIPAKQKWLWFHDIHRWDRFTPAIASQLDVIIALSQWHAGHLKRVYPFLKEAEIIDMDNSKLLYDDQWTADKFWEDKTITKIPKIAIIGDAIETSYFRRLSKKKKLHRFIWCSSPDRGLEEVLKMWKLIKKELPDAELKIFYGWDYFDSTLFIPAQRELKQRLLKLIQQEGVQWCGRVGKKELAQEMMKASILLYPPHDFRETYGISFLEAQASGILCFYRMNGALGETIGDRGIPLPLDMKPEEIVARIINTLHNTELCATIRKSARKYALARDWGVQSQKMLDLYRRIENESHRGT